MDRIKVVYIISDIDKALAFEWIAMGLSKEKFELSFLLLTAQKSSILQTFLEQNNFTVRSIVCAGKKDWPLAWLSIIKYLKRWKPDLVHCHLLQANILGLTAAKVLGIPKRIYTRHHSDYHFRYFPKGVKWDKLSNRMATHIVAPSNGVKKILMEMEHVLPDKITTINHGFDLAYFESVPKQIIASVQQKYNPEHKYPVVGVISRFTELKGIQYIIPAFEKLLEQYPNALLLLFNAKGDFAHTLNEQLKQHIPEHAYKTVAFESELAAVYQLFDVFVQVSTDTNIEAFGQTYIEALAAGVPSVFTLSGIAPDFIQHLKNAVVVPFKNEEAIYKGIHILLEDKNLRNEIIQEGLNSVQKRFSLQKMIGSLSELYYSS